MAARLHVTPKTLLAWARRGWVPCLRASQRPVLFDPEEVFTALRERARQRMEGAAHA
jgi:predicted site-specific integrase-resolvase